MNYPLAIMDYGIGGIDLLARIKVNYPGLPVLYFSDAGAIPYGRLNKKDLTNRVNKVIDYVAGAGAEKMILACHSASSVVNDHYGKFLSIRDLTIQCVQQSSAKKIGIIGGGRTIKAGYYRSKLTAVGYEVKQRIAQEFSILVERGELDSEYAHSTLRKVLSPLKSVDGLLLACTHYPALKPLITSYLPDCSILDPIDEVYKYLVNYQWLSYTGQEIADQFITTGNPDLMKEAAFKAFKFDLLNVNRCYVR